MRRRTADGKPNMNGIWQVLDTSINWNIQRWMGWSVGHWDGETLVVDVTAFNDQTWFDREQAAA